MLSFRDSKIWQGTLDIAKCNRQKMSKIFAYLFAYLSTAPKTTEGIAAKNRDLIHLYNVSDEDGAKHCDAGTAQAARERLHSTLVAFLPIRD